MHRVAIVGGTGYTGVELVRLLSRHPGVEIACVTSRQVAGTPVAEVFPSLRGHVDLRYVDPDSAPLDEVELVFFATPNGTAMRQAPTLLERGVRVVDLAADFRLRDPAEWERWYGMSHACPELLPQAAYGLPELFREEIRMARLVANPGCYPTAVCLGLAPLLEAGLVEPADLVADAKSGVSGAGRGARTDLLLGEAAESVKAYAVAGHRHRPEIVQTLSRLADGPLELTFVPHLMPMIRGIHATLYATLREQDADLQSLFETRYAGEPFVDVLPPGSHPETRSTRGANVCRLAVHRPGPGRRAVVLSVIDNLVKGAAGQAVQNMNLMLGLPETMGLEMPALLP